MRIWTVTYTNAEGDTMTEWLPTKPGAVNRSIELDCPVRVREQTLPAERADMAKWLNENQVQPPT